MIQPWWQLSTQSWRTRPGRTALTLFAVALGAGIVVWVTSCYESVRRSVTQVVLEWIGSSHVIIEPVEGVWAVFDQSLELAVAQAPGVLYTTARTREYVDAVAVDAPAPSSAADDRPDSEFNRSSGPEPIRIEVTGIVPEKELLVRQHRVSAGRFIEPGDQGAIVLEKLLADELGLAIGDRLRLRAVKAPNHERTFEIVGLIERRRASANQAPMTWTPLDEVQSLIDLPGKIKGIDIVVADPTMANIQDTADAVRAIVDQRQDTQAPSAHQSQSLSVKTTGSQHQRLGAAQDLLHFIMFLLACVVLLTAFFIILACMSMGVMERMTEMGLLRCVGVTRRQIAMLVLLQAAPLGILGALCGVPIGIALQWLTMRIAPDYLGQWIVSGRGVAMAVAGALATTVLGAVAPAVRALRVSPSEAARPHSTGRLTGWVWACAAAGLILLAAHLLLQPQPTDALDPSISRSAIALLLLLYAGGALIAPAIVLLLGHLMARIAASLLRLRPQLLTEQVDGAPFRSAAVCCGLAVGLSLIIGLIVWGQSVKQGWQFPSEFPDAMLYSYDPLPLDDAETLRDTPGIAEFTVVNDFPYSLSKPSGLPFLRSLSMLDQSSRFLAVDPDEGLDIIKLAFIEGNERDARRMLKRGGHVLVTREFAQARDASVGDSFDIWAHKRKGTFTIAGIIGSPGVDIAVSFFNASEFFQFYAVGAIFGTRDDAERVFGISGGKMMLFNFDLPEDNRRRAEATSKPTMALPTPAAPGERQTFALGPGPIPGDGPEEAVANHMLRRLGWPSKAFVTARELKMQIDRNINRVTLILSVIPTVGLVVAALGLANLMAANVASRRRQIAVLRAIGLTRGQMTRIVVGEALVLGLLGSAIGVGLGLLLARTSNGLTRALSGFEPVYAVDWPRVAAGAALAIILCMFAALVPAARAGRTDIVSVLATG